MYYVFPFSKGSLVKFIYDPKLDSKGRKKELEREAEENTNLEAKIVSHIVCQGKQNNKKRRLGERSTKAKKTRERERERERQGERWRDGEIEKVRGRRKE